MKQEWSKNARLVWKLAKNDFKKRYAGSYLGALWALAQPVVTVVMYWIVFDKIFGQKGQMLAGGASLPYVLFLTAGLVPWFFFTESFTGGTMALLEYNYLVKKVVFRIDILPVVKVLAAVFIHAFFVVVMLIVAMIYGIYPSVYTLQLIYYSFCLFMLSIALCYTTCAVVVFFRDLAQIINIVLQIGMWATPILWNMDDVLKNSPRVRMVIQINPLVYVVNGYRSSLCEKIWFFENLPATLYFWAVTAVLFGLGMMIFKRLRVHFADVL